MVDPGVQFKAVERNALSTNRDLGEVGAHFDVEAIPVHAEVAGGVTEAEQPWGNVLVTVCLSFHD